MIGLVFSFGFAVFLFVIFLMIMGVILEAIAEEPGLLWYPFILVVILLMF